MCVGQEASNLAKEYKSSQWRRWLSWTHWCGTEGEMCRMGMQLRFFSCLRVVHPIQPPCNQKGTAFPERMCSYIFFFLFVLCQHLKYHCFANRIHNFLLAPPVNSERHLTYFYIATYCFRLLRGECAPRHTSPSFQSIMV